jgi:hypothetical protein
MEVMVDDQKDEPQAICSTPVGPCIQGTRPNEFNLSRPAAWAPGCRIVTPPAMLLRLVERIFHQPMAHIRSS